MKNTMKSALAVLTFGLALAACTPKEKAADQTQDSVTVAPVDSAAITPADTTVVADSTAAH